MLLFVFNKTGDASVYEKKYSREIAFLIDQAKPGTNIVMKINYRTEISGKHFIIDESNKRVIVRLGDSTDKGFSFVYFNQASVKLDFDEDNLIIRVK